MKKIWKSDVCLLGLVQVLLEQWNLGWVNLGWALMYASVFVVISGIYILEVWGLGSPAFSVSNARYGERGSGVGQTVWKGINSV